MPAIQNEKQWWQAVEHALILVAEYELGEESLYSVWEDGISPLAWPNSPGDAPWRQRFAAEIYGLADLNFLLDGTVASLRAFDDEPTFMASMSEAGEDLLAQVKTLLLRIQAAR